MFQSAKDRETLINTTDIQETQKIHALGGELTWPLQSRLLSTCANRDRNKPPKDQDDLQVNCLQGQHSTLLKEDNKTHITQCRKKRTMNVQLAIHINRTENKYKI